MCYLLPLFVETLHYCFLIIFRTFLSIIVNIENIIRLILQSIFNFLSSIFQAISLLPMCVVFILTSNVKGCFCGGGLNGCCRWCGSTFTVFLVITIMYLLYNGGYIESILAKMGYTKLPVSTASSDNHTTRSTVSTTPLLMQMLDNMSKTKNYKDTEPPIFYVV